MKLSSSFLARCVLAATFALAPQLAHAENEALLDAQNLNGSGVLQCESQDYQYNRCEIGRGLIEVTLERQLSTKSPCIQGRTWGVDRTGIWVNSGCRALFRYYTRGGNGGGYPSPRETRLNCESVDFHTTRCEVGAFIRYARMEQQYSNAACVEGRTWGIDRSAVWVTSGCRARFRVGF